MVRLQFAFLSGESLEDLDPWVLSLGSCWTGNQRLTWGQVAEGLGELRG